MELLTESLKRLPEYTITPEFVYLSQRPCSREELERIDISLGKIPSRLRDLLYITNGAQIFKKDKMIPFFKLFGLSEPQDDQESDWYIDRFTLKWRASFHRRNDWVIGITSYGGIVVMNNEDLVGQWDSATKSWEFENMHFDEWVRRLISEGRTYLNEQ